MSLYDWLLFLHVLAAFSVVAGEALFTLLIVGSWRRDAPNEVLSLFRLIRLGNALVGVGLGGVLVFGIALAFEADAYAIWDGWIIAALVLWVVFSAVGNRTGRIYDRARDRARALVAKEAMGPSSDLNALLRSREGLVFQSASVAVVLLLLLDMIFKPGA